MRSCRYLHKDFCQTLGISFSIFVEQWSLIAEWCEGSAQAYVNKQAVEGN